MFAGLFLMLAARQKAAPAFPAFTSAEFQETARQVETGLSKGDFAAAQRWVKLLPKHAFTIAVDDDKVPTALRPSFRAACAKAMDNWGAQPVIDSAKPDIRVSFEPVLATDAELDGHANLAEFFSHVPSEPRLSVALGLRRGNPERDATAADVFNDVRFAIGSYLGIARHSFPAFVMDPSAPTDDVRKIWPVERKAAVGALNLADLLRRAVATRTAIAVAGHPRAILSPSQFTGKALQGDQMEIPIQMSNSGTGTLVVDAIGDCACVVPESAPSLGPGGKGVIHVRLDTKEYSTAIDRSVIVLTNDPGEPIYTSAIHVDVAPRYRILIPEGQTWVFADGGKEGDAYFVFADGGDMKLIDARIIGMQGARATFEAWKGVLPDPEMNQPAAPRHGYHIHVSLPNSVLPGRTSVGLSLFTNDLEFPNPTQTIYLQRGIVALPEEVFLDWGAKPRTAVVLLSRPGHPFGVLSATSDLPSFRAAALPAEQPGVVKLEIKYDGQAPKGDVSGTITVRTDDPRQPTLRVRIAGSVQ